MECFKDEKYKCEFIPNFIDIEKYTFRSIKEVQPNLLWVRSLHKIYNPKMAIKVLSVITKKYPHAKLCMVGPDKDGSMIKCKNLSKKLKIENNVKFTGILDQDEWIKLSEEYDVFINTTNADNMPVSIIECLALGLPIVSTNVGGLAYLLENNKNALLVKK